MIFEAFICRMLFPTFLCCGRARSCHLFFIIKFERALEANWKLLSLPDDAFPRPLLTSVYDVVIAAALLIIDLTVSDVTYRFQGIFIRCIKYGNF